MRGVSLNVEGVGEELKVEQQHTRSRKASGRRRTQTVTRPTDPETKMVIKYKECVEPGTSVPV